MRKRAIIGSAVVLVLLIGGWWLFWPSGDASSSPADDPHADQGRPGPDEQAADDDFDAGVLEVSGDVVDAHGAPVPGATVQLFLEDQLPWAQTCAVCGMSLFECSDPAELTRTMDRLVHQELVPTPWGTTTTDAEGRYRFVDAPNVGRLLVARSGSRLGVGEGEERSIVLGPPGAKTVSLVDEGQTPVPGVRVVVLTRALELFELRSGLDGQVTWSGTTDGWLLAAAPGYLATVAGTEESQVILSRPRILHVHTRTGGQPIDADVAVTLHGAEKHFTTRSGELTLDQLGPEMLTLSVSTATLVGHVSVVELPKPENDVTVELRAAGRLLLTVVDEQGLPVKNASASLESVEASANADDPGEGALLTLGPLPEGEYTLMVTAEGMREVRRVHDLLPGDKTLEVTLNRAAVLQGTVMGPTGPAGGVLVSMTAPGLPDNSTMSGDDGTFSFEGPPIADVVLDASEQTLGRAQAHAAMPGKVTLTLAPRAVLQLEVSDTEAMNIMRCDLNDAHGGHHRVVFEFDEAKRHGTAKVAALTPGLWDLSLHARHREVVERQVTVADGAVTTERISLSAGVTIEGTVIDADGKPAVDVSVAIRGQAEVTDAQGRFQFSGVKPGVTRISANLPDDQLAEVLEVEAPARGVVIKARRAPKITGVVVDTHGVPVKDYEANGVQVRDPAGRFSAPVRLGQLSIWADGYKPLSMDLEAGKVDVGTLTLESVNFAEGEVVDVEGKPVGGVSVRVIPTGAESMTGANGRFKVEAGTCEPGEKCEVVATRGASLAKVPYKAGSTHHLQLARGTHVVGHVTAQGKPLPNMTVQVEGRGELWANRTETTDAQGHFEVDLCPGTWTFTASGVRVARTIEVSGERAEIELGGDVGRCSLTITNAPSLESILLEPRVGEDDFGGSYRAGTIEITGLHGQPPMAHAVPCGDFLMTLSEGGASNAVPVHLDVNTVYDARQAAADPESGGGKVIIIRSHERIEQ